MLFPEMGEQVWGEEIKNVGLGIVLSLNCCSGLNCVP